MIIDFKNGKSVVVGRKPVTFGREGKRRFITYHLPKLRFAQKAWVREIKQIRPGVKV